MEVWCGDQKTTVLSVEQRSQKMLVWLSPPAPVLKNNRHTSLYTFKAYSMMVWCILWNDYRNSFSYHLSSYIDKEKRKEKISLWLRTLRISPPNNFPIYHIAVSAVVTMLYVTSLVLTYLVTRSLYLLTTSLQFSHSPPLASGNHKCDFFFCKFVCLDPTYKWGHTVFIFLCPAYFTVSYPWKECKLVQLLWKTEWRLPLLPNLK